MTDDLDRVLTPDGLAYAQFLHDASEPVGLAVSESVLMSAHMADDEIINAANYEDADVGESMAYLKALWPVVQALSPEAATALALRHPQLWHVDAN
jgi:hypothetical protein